MLTELRSTFSISKTASSEIAIIKNEAELHKCKEYFPLVILGNASKHKDCDFLIKKILQDQIWACIEFKQKNGQYQLEKGNVWQVDDFAEAQSPLQNTPDMRVSKLI